MTKLIRVTTVPLSLHKLLKGQPEFMQKSGFDVRLLSAAGPEIPLIKEETGFEVKNFPYTREISPVTDLKALWLTYKYFKIEKPQVVHTHTPKAGIVGMLAAKLAGVPLRMHTVAGLPLLETAGVKRKVLDYVERLTSWSATNVYPNSFALKEIMVNEKLAPEHKLKVIANGSSNGIDTEYFNKLKVKSLKLKGEGDKVKYKREKFTQSEAEGIKDKDNFQPTTNNQQPTTNNYITFCFIGRVVKDKGINELLSAFDKLSKENSKVKLILVGYDKKELESDPLAKESMQVLERNKQIETIGWQEDVRPFLAVSDVLVFPSYREGFPNVVLQAGAMGLPSIVTDINGSNEIIEEGINGLIIPVKDEKALFNNMKLLANDEELRMKLAESARKIVVDRYEQEFVWKELLKEYKRLLEEKGLKAKDKVKKIKDKRR